MLNVAPKAHYFSIEREYVFSAKGAVFILAWGSALGIVQRRDPSAEGAIHSGASSIWRYATNRVR